MGYVPATLLEANFDDSKDFKDQKCFSKFFIAGSMQMHREEDSATAAAPATLNVPNALIGFDDAGQTVKGCLLTEVKHDKLNGAKKGRISLKSELALMEPENKAGLALWTYLKNKGETMVEKVAMVWLDKSSGAWALKDGFRWEYEIEPKDLKFVDIGPITLEKEKLCPEGSTSTCGTSWTTVKKDYRFFRSSGGGTEKGFDRLNPTGFWNRFKGKIKDKLTHQYKSDKWHKVTIATDVTSVVKGRIKPFPILKKGLLEGMANDVRPKPQRRKALLTKWRTSATAG